MEKCVGYGRKRTYSMAIIALTIGCVLLLYMGGKVDKTRATSNNELSSVVKIVKSAKSSLNSKESSQMSSNDINMTIQSKSSASNTIHILLNGYQRSGSSYTGKLLVSQPNTFYFFEAWSSLTEWGHFTVNDLVCDDLTGACSSLNSSSKQLKLIEKHLGRYNISKREHFVKILHQLLHNIYNCQLDDLENLINDGHTKTALKKNWRKYNSCRNQSKRDCLPVLAEICRQSRIRVIKLVRWSLTIAAPVLEKDPTLKLVQLFRDPRGVIASRLVKTDWYPLKVKNANYSRILKNAEVLCKRMADDFEAGSKLRRRYPDRVKFIKYEDLNGHDAEALEVKDELRTFLNLGKSPNAPDSKSSSNSDWVRVLEWQVIKIVDSACANVYKNLDYRKIDYRTWLNKKQIV